MAHKEEKRGVLESIWNHIKPLAASKNGCRKALLGPHLARLKQSPSLATTIPVEFEGEPGYVSLCQEGGSVRVILWSPERRMSHVREAIETIARSLRNITYLNVHGGVQIRWMHPKDNKWVGARGGWPLRNGCYKED